MCVGVICAALVGMFRDPAVPAAPQAGTVPAPEGIAQAQTGTAAPPGSARSKAGPPASRAQAQTASASGANRPPPDPLPSNTGQCPSAVTCNRFGFFQGDSADRAPRWPADSNGIATVPYRINTTGAVTNLSQEDIGNAVSAAFETWQRALPTVRFVFEGFTLIPPLPGDGINVIGFGDLDNREDLGFAQVQAEGNDIVEADMTLVLSTEQTSGAAVLLSGWGWAPCSQRDGACADTQLCESGLDAVGVRRCYNDVQNVVTHEIGHWLWLADVGADDGSAMTMYGSVETGTVTEPVTERVKVTLALGDVVGARTLYPCGCALPAIVRP